MSTTRFSTAFNVFITKAGILELILNSASYFDLRYKKCFFIWVSNVARHFFYFLDVIAESEDDGGISSSILPVTDDVVFFEIPFQNIASG